MMDLKKREMAKLITNLNFSAYGNFKIAQLHFKSRKRF